MQIIKFDKDGILTLIRSSSLVAIFTSSLQQSHQSSRTIFFVRVEYKLV